MVCVLESQSMMRFVHVFVISCSVVCAQLGAVSSACAGSFDKLYWTDTKLGIQRSDPDGSNREDIVTIELFDGRNFTLYHGLDIDTSSGFMYWADETGGKEFARSGRIIRSTLNGDDVQDLITGLGVPSDVELDLVHGHIYWNEFLVHGGGSPAVIRRANLDGTNVTDVVSGLDGAGGIALDLVNDHIYWTENVSDRIRRADLDGTNVTDIITTGLDSPQDLVLDVTHDHIYFTNDLLHKIQRSDLHGSNIVDLVTDGIDRPHDIALDLTEEKMYWTESNGRIQMSNLDGSVVTDILLSDGLRHVALVEIPEPMTVSILLLTGALVVFNRKM